MNDLLRARLAAQCGLVTAREAYSCGYTSVSLSLSRLVASGELFRARAGCFVDGRLLAEASPEERHALTAGAVSRGYRPPHAISHLSALAVHGLPLLHIEPDAVHLTLTGPGCPRTLRGLRVHPELPDSVARQRGVAPVVHPSVAVVQSAALAGVTAGVAAADAALYAGQVTKGDLEVALRIARLGPGRADARTAVELAESPGESWARVLFVSLGLPAVELQAKIRDVRGKFVGRVDFLFRKYRTVVEFDGLVKYGGAGGRQALVDEKRREDALRSLGYQVVRLTWRDLHDPALVDRLIKQAFSRA